MKKFAVIATCIIASLPTAALAAKTVYSPGVEFGATEIEAFADRTRDDRPGVGGEEKILFGVGHGVTQKWFTEVYAEFEKDTTTGERELEAVEWENRFQIGEAGQYAADFGFLAELEIPAEDTNPYALEFGPLIEKDLGGKWVGTLNLLGEVAGGNGMDAELEGSAAGRLRYAYSRGFEAGLDVFSSDASSSAGPVVKGKIGHGKSYWGYEAGVQFALADNTPDQTFKLLLEYEF